MDNNHFVEKGYKPQPKKFLNDAAYADVLDQIVISCADVMITRQVNGHKKILLGERAYLPMKGWWIFGGRRMPGESPVESCARNMRREIGLDLKPNRFTLLKCYSYVWAKRRQEPQNHGSHTDSWTYFIELFDNEIDQLKLNEEYSGSKWVSIPEILESGSAYFPAILQMIRDLDAVFSRHQS